jgi:Tfp pilus assembly protein PilV
MRQQAGDAGFTLVEALLATLVLSIGVVGLMSLVVNAMRATRDARDSGMATWLTWQKLEDLRARNDLTASPGDTLAADTAGFVEYLDQAGHQVQPPGLYTRRWLVEFTSGTIRIVVRVHHRASPGTPARIGTVVRAGGSS